MDIKNQLHLEIVIAVFDLQNGKRLKNPVNIQKSSFETLRVLCLLTFLNSAKSFGYCFVLLNICFIVFVIVNYRMNRRSYVKIYPMFITLHLIESVCFAIIGLYCTDA